MFQKQLDEKWLNQSMKRCREIEKCIEQRNLSKKDEMLRSLYEIMKVLCENIDGPSRENFYISQTIERLLAMSGNSATIRKNIAKQGIIILFRHKYHSENRILFKGLAKIQVATLYFGLNIVWKMFLQNNETLSFLVIGLIYYYGFKRCPSAHYYSIFLERFYY